ncbi:glycoside hydrolase family 88 protein [Arcticibacter tournemirensis]|uniref:Glucuronyl hydrolase n=1 Tax=Arcticibacter tournemirensis TaxID=699437 RepID=A0A4Q0M7D6_9SPHI|nr:glycoside hydrolase family 88 protein [Arcticibacter tournemirensis]RXF68626.1 glucuronyl hydrolase [Arcticibacter tournemirensis]
MRFFFLFVAVFFAAHLVAAKPDSAGLVKAGFSAAEKQYAYMLSAYTDLKLYPRSADPNGKTTFTTIGDWTGGFWPGCLWYVYEYSNDEKWKSAAVKWTESLEKNQFNTNHHDIGFMMNCSYGNAYRLTGNESYKRILIQSAKSLATRFNPVVGAIKSWEVFHSWDGKAVYNFPVIIDNMMNLELLFLASKLSGDANFRNIAIKHAETTLKNHYRPDYSSFHVVNYDAKTGKVLSRETAQGFSDNSAWSRGQAWGLYGFTNVYKETGQKRFLRAAIKMAEFYINNHNLPADKIPYWDFNVNQAGYTPNWKYDASRFKEIPRDASAAAITSSALLELCRYVNGRQKEQFFSMAKAILQSLSSPQYTAAPGTNGYFVLKHSVGSIPHNGEIDVPLVYADYYYLEALLRFKRFRF